MNGLMQRTGPGGAGLFHVGVQERETPAVWNFFRVLTDAPMRTTDRASRAVGRSVKESVTNSAS